jgi:hypothetical protein
MEDAGKLSAMKMNELSTISSLHAAGALWEWTLDKPHC